MGTGAPTWIGLKQPEAPGPEGRGQGGRRARLGGDQLACVFRLHHPDRRGDGTMWDHTAEARKHLAKLGTTSRFRNLARGEETWLLVECPALWF